MSIPDHGDTRRRSRHRGRVVLALLLVLSMSVYVSSALSSDTRVDRRAADMPMPDPYLDPTWPEEELGEGLGDRYEEGDSDSVEDVPFEEDTELQAEQRALEALTGEAPAAPAEPGPALPPADDAPPAAPVPGVPTPAATDDDEILPGDDHRDPVEW